MNTGNRFDLLEILQTLKKHLIFIISISILAAIVGAGFYFVKGKKYKARAEFMISNPLYADRSYIFRKDEAKFIGYFDDDADMDKIISIMESDSVVFSLVHTFGLNELYHLDTNMIKVKEEFKKNFEIRRTDYGCLQVTFIDKDAHLAIAVVNEAIRLTEDQYHGFFNRIRNNIYTSIKLKLVEIDSSITSLTDTLAKLRNQYGIYDIISPSRHDINTQSMKSNGKGDYGMGIELVQNIESIKDQEVMDRAHYISLLNEYSTGTKYGQNSLIQIISSPKVPKRNGPGGFITCLTALLVGAFFSSVWVLLRKYYPSFFGGKK